MKCPKCGRENPSGAQFCTWCGEKMPETKQSDSNNTAVIGIIAAAVLTLIFFLLFLNRSHQPKGYYDLFNTKGELIAELKLTGGKYELTDRQDYSAYGSAEGSVPDLIFAHDFKIGKSGLEWKETIKGKLTGTREKGVYVLKDLSGGLFSEPENMYLIYAGDRVYMYTDGDAEMLQLRLKEGN